MIIKNFRSIESVENMALGRLTVLYGPTASGKSSLLYAPLVLRNFIINPNRQADGLFHLGFMDLGGYDACVFNHESGRSITVSVTHENNNVNLFFGLTFSKSAGIINLKVDSLDMQAKVTIPYPVNLTVALLYKEGEEEYNINWNGILCSVVPKKPTAETQQKALAIATQINSATEFIKGFDIAPHKRGFFKPVYTPVAVSPIPTTEDEVASIIINDPNMAGRISTYIEEIFGRDFRTHIPPGTASVYFKTTDKKSRTPVDLVNDGFGVNQCTYLFAKMIRSDVHTIFIEEPEVHLHPSVIRRFVQAMLNFIREEGKQIIFTTHNEQLLISLLTFISEGIASPEDIKCYLVTKDKRITRIQEQKVQKNGQIEGGLSSFIEAEVKDLMKFLGIK